MTLVKVKPGDSLASIAKRYGCSWRAMYHLPRNKDYRARRPNPNLIQPGDEIWVPDKNEAMRRLGAFGRKEDE